MPAGFSGDRRGAVPPDLPAKGREAFGNLDAALQADSHFPCSARGAQRRGPGPILPAAPGAR